MFDFGNNGKNDSFWNFGSSATDDNGWSLGGKKDRKEMEDLWGLAEQEGKSFWELLLDFIFS